MKTDSSMRRVLFVVGTWGIGGVERVTSLLANELVRLGWRVHLAALRFDREDETIIELDPNVERHSYSLGRFCDFRRLLKSEEIECIINQWALPAPVSAFLRISSIGLGIKLLSVQHNAPNWSNRLLTARTYLMQVVWRLVASVSLRMVYWLNDAYVILSPSYVKPFMMFAGVRSDAKIHIIGNPIRRLDVGVCEKENLIVYVGRLSLPEKRVDRIVAVWREVADKLPDWRLEIVGDGPDRGELENIARGVPRMAFVGFRRPDEYYARSKILLLTSEYEGFGLVLVEAMAAGCVPIALGSFLSAYDIIRPGTGIVVDGHWNVDRFGEMILSLANNDARRKDLAARAKDVAKSYSPDHIAYQYVELIEECLRT